RRAPFSLLPKCRSFLALILMSSRSFDLLTQKMIKQPQYSTDKLQVENCELHQTSSTLQAFSPVQKENYAITEVITTVRAGEALLKTIEAQLRTENHALRE